MKRENIKQVICELFRQNFNAYPENFEPPAEATEAAKETAKGYWDNRNEMEVERDNEAEVTAQDYENWCLAELEELKEQQA